MEGRGIGRGGREEEKREWTGRGDRRENNSIIMS